MTKAQTILLWTAIIGVFFLIIWNILLQQEIDDQDERRTGPWVCTTIADYYGNGAEARPSMIMECD